MRPRKQVTVCGAAIFCVAVFSLYVMLDRVQSDYQRRHDSRRDDLPRGQLSVLHSKMEQLEELLEENHHIISNLRHSVLELDVGRLAPSPPPASWPGPARLPNGTWLLPSWAFPFPASVSVADGDCRFSSEASQTTGRDVQMLDVYRLLPFDNPDGGVWRQGFDITYDVGAWEQRPLQIIVVPHSHNDPGWLKTFDKYYVDQTQHILNHMVTKLLEDRRRSFVWAEVSFFAKWWDAADSQRRHSVRRLVERGQLEFVTGGWVMTDEANTHYFAIIDQMIEGHQWLHKTLGVRPRSGWAIDPFGHSPTMAYVLRRAGLQAMLIQRVHYAVKRHLAHERSLEFMWRQDWDMGTSTDILCHMMPFYSYDVPHTCGPDPKVCCQFDFKRLPGSRVNCPWKLAPRAITADNVAERANLLLDQYRKKASLFRGGAVLVQLGDDFRFETAHEWEQQFHNYQQLFDYINSHPELHARVQFGTLSDYFKALGVWEVSGNASISPPPPPPPALPVLGGDFFTYADREDHYWSGYFTSRPFFKHLDRRLEAHLRAAELLFSLASWHASRRGVTPLLPARECFARLEGARRNLALFQHHDAITGTSRELVVSDYAARLMRALADLQRVLVDAALVLLLAEPGRSAASAPSQPSFFFLLEENVVDYDSLPNKAVIKLTSAPRSLVVHNALEWERVCVVSVRVDSPLANVLAHDGSGVLAQVDPLWSSSTGMSARAFQLQFLARVPALGLAVYRLTLEAPPVPAVRSDTTLYLPGGGPVPPRTQPLLPLSLLPPPTTQFSVETASVEAGFSGRTGMLRWVRLKAGGEPRLLRLDLLWYGTRRSKDKSGAYLFLPDGEGKPYESAERPVVRVTRGPLVSEVTCVYPHVQHSVRLYNLPGVEGLSLEVSNVVDLRDQNNRELSMRVSSDVESGGNFQTDLNGFQMQPRRFWKKLPLQANFYPVATMALVQDARSRLSLLTAQAGGVASLADGQLEVMLDRRLIQDDNRGLGQGLKDNRRSLSRFRLLLETRSPDGTKWDATKAAALGFPSLLGHVASAALNHPPFVLVGVEQRLSPLAEPPQLLPSFHVLGTPVPCDLHLLNLRMMEAPGAGSPGEAALLLHRKGFDCGFPSAGLGGFNCSTTGGKLSLGDLFRKLRLRSVTPSSLTLLHSQPAGPNASRVELAPMEIAAFRVSYV
ncbi:alpha-mannosidase 2x-like [Lampetra planeri]